MRTIKNFTVYSDMADEILLELGMIERGIVPIDQIKKHKAEALSDFVDAYAREMIAVALLEVKCAQVHPKPDDSPRLIQHLRKNFVNADVVDLIAYLKQRGFGSFKQDLRDSIKTLYDEDYYKIAGITNLPLRDVDNFKFELVTFTNKMSGFSLTGLKYYGAIDADFYKDERVYAACVKYDKTDTNPASLETKRSANDTTSILFTEKEYKEFERLCKLRGEKNSRLVLSGLSHDRFKMADYGVKMNFTEYARVVDEVINSDRIHRQKSFSILEELSDERS